MYHSGQFIAEFLSTYDHTLGLVHSMSGQPDMWRSWLHSVCSHCHRRTCRYHGMIGTEHFHDAPHSGVSQGQDIVVLKEERFLQGKKIRKATQRKAISSKLMIKKLINQNSNVLQPKRDDNCQSTFLQQWRRKRSHISAHSIYMSVSHRPSRAYT